MLSINELAALLGVSRSTVNAWRMDGAAPAEIKLDGGKLIRFRREDIDRWLESEAA
ncbi:helix-turn-helix transcriptional regulator [Corynebacterium occultum]|uniref:helix-turn-helix transcriptional regulator n=1 Tax=Corynebacterium occultum TaxID=2675219 RepID=UPI001E64E0F3